MKLLVLIYCKTDSYKVVSVSYLIDFRMARSLQSLNKCFSPKKCKRPPHYTPLPLGEKIEVREKNEEAESFLHREHMRTMGGIPQ